MTVIARLAMAGVRRRGPLQVLVLVAVTALASAAVVAGLASLTTTGDLVDEAYDRAGRPDLVLYGEASTLRDAADDPAVAAASGPALRASAETLVDGDPVDVTVLAVEPGSTDAVGAPRLVDGRWPARGDEVVVERSLTVEGAVAIGGELELRTPTGARTVTVVGDAVDLTDCFWPNCDPLRTFGLPTLAQSLLDPGSDPMYLAAYRLHDPGTAAAVGARLQGDAPDGIRGHNTWPDTRGDILVVGDVFGAMVAGFGAFLLVAACFVVAGATTARLVGRQRSMALLRAVGFRTRQLTAALLAEHLLIGSAGVVAGWLVGSLAAPQLGGVHQIVDTNTSPFRLAPLVVALVVVNVCLAIAVAVPAWRAGRRPPTESLRDTPSTPHGGSVVAAVARRLGAGPVVVAGLRRAVARPGRAMLATGAILVAAAGTVLAAGFIGGVHRAVDDPARTGNPFDGYAVSTGATDGEIASALDLVPEVASWHTEVELPATIGEATYTARVLGGDEADYRVQEGRPLAEPGDALVGYAFLDETGLEVGDEMVAAIAGRDVELRIVGWYLEAADGGKVVLLREESLPADVAADRDTFRFVAAEGVEPEAATAAVAEQLGDGATVVTADFGDGGIGAIIGTLVGFAVLLAGVALANLLATTLSSTRERARALGVLRTVGCTTRQLVGQAAAGAAMLGFVAGAVGAPLGWWLFRVLSDAVTAAAGIGPGLAPSPSPWLVAAVVPVAALLSAAAGALAAAGLSRRPAAELVRYE